MDEAIRTRNPGRTATAALLAGSVLVVMTLASALEPAATPDSGSSPAVHPGVHPVVQPVAHPGVYPKRPGGWDFAEGPYVERHATEVVAGY